MTKTCLSVKGERVSMPRSTVRSSAVSALRLAVRWWSMSERALNSTRKCRAVAGVAWLGHARAFLAEHPAGGGFGVEGIGLPGVGMCGSWSGAHFADGYAPSCQCRGEGGSVGGCAFDGGEDGARSVARDPSQCPVDSRR